MPQKPRKQPAKHQSLFIKGISSAEHYSTRYEEKIKSLKHTQKETIHEKKKINIMTTSFEEYIQSVDLEKLFKKLAAANPETLAETVTHFTTKEAKKRDKIVLCYFGENGVNRIVEAITERLLSAPKLRTSWTLAQAQDSSQPKSPNESQTSTSTPWTQHQPCY